MFLVQKPCGGIRPIFDLRGLNRFIFTKPFHLISQIDVMNFLQKKDWLAKIDLEQAYFHLPIAESHRRFLRIIYKQEILQLTALPFGLSSAPQTFAALSNWIAEILRARGIRVVVFLDDYLLVNQDRSILRDQVTETVTLLRNLGWHINHPKSILVPVQQIEYLGLIWDTHKNVVKLPEKKITGIKLALTKLISQRHCTLKQAQRVLGQLNFANYAVPKGRLHCRNFQIFLRRFKQGRLREKKFLSPNILQDLKWWLHSINHSTVPLENREVTHYLTSDAANVGWGAHLNGKHLAGQWTPEQKLWHSNVKELYAVFAAIQSQQKVLLNAHILVQSDNRTILAYIKNQGGTRSYAMLNLTIKLLELTEQLNVTLSASYLPGRLNGIADRLSRGRPLPEWHLLPQATEVIFRKWGVPEVDLFASKTTAVVPRYVTLDAKDCSALFCDAFSRQWNFGLAWIFPPPNLIPRVLAHLNRAKGNYIIIAPHWDQCFWLPDLQSRKLTEPVPILNLRKVLIDQSTGLSPAQVDQLRLRAWRVGGGLNK